VKTIGGKILEGSVLFLLFLCLTLPAFPALASAGIAVGPSAINLDDAVRGGDYDFSISVLNGGDKAADFTFTPQGEAANWISLSYDGQPVDRVTIAPNVREPVKVTISIPKDAANGKYASEILCTSLPPGGIGQSVGLGATVTVSIIVTGTEIIAGKINGASTADTEAGVPLLLRVYFENEGNVAVAPTIGVIIVRSGQTIDNFNYSNTTVKPGKSDIINIQWDTSQREPADYTAKVNVLLEGLQIYSTDLPFKVLPLGTLTRSGEISYINIAGNRQLGSVSKVEALFKNTGDTDVMARLVGEIYLDNNLVQLLEGEQTLVEKGKQDIIQAYFTPEQAGTYTLKTQVDMGGKKTDVKEVTIEIGAPQVATSTSEPTSQTNELIVPPTASESDSGNGFSLSSLPWLYIGGGAGVVLIIVIIIFLMSKR
jgi:hypothetical protein